MSDNDLIRRGDALALRDKIADIIGARPMSSIHSALSEYRNAIRAIPATDAPGFYEIDLGPGGTITVGEGGHFTVKTIGGKTVVSAERCIIRGSGKPATDAREKALREAAAIASKLAAQWWSEYKNVGHEKAYSTHHEGMSDGADEVATAILRALEEEGRDG